MYTSRRYLKAAPLLIGLLLLTNTVLAQTNPYLADLAALRATLQKTPAYKAQIRGDKRAAYDSLYQRLALDTVSQPLSYRYFTNLAQLLFPLRDNHLGFRQIFAFQTFRSKASLDSFMTSREFLTYPGSYPINVDSLKAELVRRPLDSLEGIYHYAKSYSIGLFKSGPRRYVGVVVDPDSTLWRKGQPVVWLYEAGPGTYRAIYSHPVYRLLMYQSIERFTSYALINSGFYKGAYTKQQQQGINHTNLSSNAPYFAMRNLSDTVQYLLVRSFQRNSVTAQRSRAFHDSIRHALTAPHLIVDLRNNEGGADKEARKYVSLIRKYARRGHLYLLINNGTLSQAEIFALKFVGRRNVTIVGQTSRGMLSYGSNYGTWQKLPSGKMDVYPTDMKNGSALLPYEDRGIRPDVTLRSEVDWLDQVTALIQSGEVAKQPSSVHRPQPSTALVDWEH